MKNIYKYKNVKFIKVDGYKCNMRLFNLHKKLYNLCKRHGAILDLASSDIDIYIHNGSQKLIDKIKEIEQYYDPSEIFGGVTWENKQTKEIRIY